MFLGPNSMAFGEATAVYALFSHICYDTVFGGLGDLMVTPVEGCHWGLCDSIPMLGYKQACFVVTIPTSGRS